MKKLFSLLALSVTVAFAANAAEIVVNSSCAGPGCADRSAMSVGGDVSSELKEKYGKYSTPVSVRANNYFSLDSRASSPEQNIYGIGTDAVSKISNAATTWEARIDGSSVNNPSYQAHRHAALQEQARRTDATVSKFSSDLQQRLGNALHRYKAWLESVRDQDKEFERMAKDATAEAMTAASTHTVAFSTNVDAQVKNMGYEQFASNVIFAGQF